MAKVTGIKAKVEADFDSVWSGFKALQACFRWFKAVVIAIGSKIPTESGLDIWHKRIHL